MRERGSPLTDKLKEVFFWEGQKADVVDFLRQCESCQRVKAPRHKPHGELHPLQVPFRRWESVSMDLITDLPQSEKGHDSIVVFVDRLSKMVHLAPCKKTVTAEQLGELMEHYVFRLHGVPQDIVSDRDVRFQASFWQESLSGLRVKLNMSTAKHPETDGHNREGKSGSGGYPPPLCEP